MKDNNRKKFDIILYNPPFNLGVKFFQKYFEIADKIITIQPTKWLLTNKQNKNLTNKIDNQYCEIETLNGNEYFDAILFADLSINYVNSKNPHKLIFNNKEYNKCEEITQFSTDSLLKEFNNKIGNIENSIWDHIKGTMYYYKGYEEHPNENWWIVRLSEIRGNVTAKGNKEFNNKIVNIKNSIWDHIKGTMYYYKGYEEHPNENWWIVRLSEIRGHVATKGNKEASDFYTIISNNDEFMKKNNIGQYKDIKKIPTRKGKYEFCYFAFETKQELNNFIRYIKTDFVRGCLKLSKNHANQFRGCFKTIPWFDFSDEHFSKSPREIDDWLFKKYNISDEIRKHIEEILPDYYNIRGNL